MFNKSAAPMEVQIHDLFVIVGPNMKQRSNDDSFIDPEEDLIAPYDDSNMYNILTNTLTVKKAPRLKPSPSKFNFQFMYFDYRWSRQHTFWPGSSRSCKIDSLGDQSLPHKIRGWLLRRFGKALLIWYPRRWIQVHDWLGDQRKDSAQSDSTSKCESVLEFPIRDVYPIIIVGADLKLKILNFWCYGSFPTCIDDVRCLHQWEVVIDLAVYGWYSALFRRE